MRARLTDRHRRIVVVCADALLMLGAVCLSLAGASFFGVDWPGAQFPPGVVTGIERDSRGFSYVGSDPYGRIQVFDPTGTFVRGWFVGAAGGSFRFRVDSLVHVYVPRTRTLRVFSVDGELLRERRSSGAGMRESPPGGVRVGGEMQVPWLLLLVNFPFPTALYIMLGAAGRVLKRRTAV